MPSGTFPVGDATVMVTPSPGADAPFSMISPMLTATFVLPLGGYDNHAGIGVGMGGGGGHVTAVLGVSAGLDGLTAAPPPQDASSETEAIPSADNRSRTRTFTPPGKPSS